MPDVLNSVLKLVFVGDFTDSRECCTSKPKVVQDFKSFFFYVCVVGKKEQETSC